MSWQERDYIRGGPGGTGGFGGLSSGGARFRDNPLNWSPTLGHVAGIRIRVHILFILYIGFELLGAGSWLFFEAQLLFILFASVFLHELGHCFAARAVGGGADDVLMWPLGGLATVDAPRQPWPQFVTVVCGPLVNVALFCVAWLLLELGLGQGSGALFNPFEGWGAVAASWGNVHAWLSLIFKLNLVLFIFNLFPMYPMDGGRMLHCALWRWFGLSQAMTITTTVGMVAAIVLGLYGLTNSQYLLMAIAFMGYMACYQERQVLKTAALQEDGFMGHDFSGGYSTLEPPRKKRKGWFARWREKTKHAGWEAKRRDMLQLEEHVDRILDKVRDQGIGALTRREKKLLEEATKRKQAEDRRHGF